MNFKQLTIGNKITLGFGLIFTLLTLVTGIAYTALSGAGQRLAKFSEQRPGNLCGRNARILDAGAQAPRKRVLGHRLGREHRRL